MQLTTEQRIFVVTKYHETKSYNEVREAFARRFPNRNAPPKKTIYKNVLKYQQNGTSLNLNKGRSGRRVSVRTPDNIQLVRDALNANPQMSTRRKDVPVSRRSFQRLRNPAACRKHRGLPRRVRSPSMVMMRGKSLRIGPASRWTREIGVPLCTSGLLR